jgi:hypothetical protein
MYSRGLSSMAKQNCWEFKKCERESGGEKVSELGVCPSASEISANSINGGKNAGRACWTLSGTFCGSKVQGTFAKKLESCMACEFYHRVAKEEGIDSKNQMSNILNRYRAL